MGPGDSACPLLNEEGQVLIRELCSVKERQGLTYSSLARLTNYSRASWERWLNGKRLITVAALRSLAGALALDAGPWLTLLDRAALRRPGDGDRPARAHETVSPDSQPPVAQLPPDIADFAGRHGEAHALAEMVAGHDQHGSDGAPTLVVVCGGGGLGKTALAVRVAHNVAAQFPDGQMFADLRGGDPRPARAAAVLSSWLAALGEAPESIPLTVADRSARFRTLLHQRKMLLFLDNATDAEDIRPLLPASSTCTVLVTSRSRLEGLAGARRIELAPLADDDAMQILQRQVGAGRLAAEPHASQAVVRACSGVPLALRIAGARLARRPTWPVAELAGRLADRRHLLDELQAGELSARASLAVSYSTLIAGKARRGRPSPAQSARAFRLLGLVPLPRVPADAAAALAGLKTREASYVLEQLVDAHLLQSPAPGHYRMHDLVRLYAAEQSMLEDPGPERTEAIARLLLWYAHGVVAAMTVIVPTARPPALPPADWHFQFDSYQHASSWCQQESWNIALAVRWGNDQGHEQLAWQLASALSLTSLMDNEAGWRNRTSQPERDQRDTSSSSAQEAELPVSEYQYYHFLAIDVPLDEGQREELRELSSRADITANSFINEYNWGDFRGDPKELMERYFDAFLYFANWGSRRLMFRLPREQLDAKTIGQYLYADVASVSETAEHVIISLAVEPGDSLDDWIEPGGQLAAMVPVRSDLAAGDLRLAYLGWLLAIEWDEIDEEDVEPPVPAGLGKLNGPLRAIADFLSIDEDLLAEAATASPALQAAGDRRDISGWIAGLPDAEKNALLLRVADGEGGYVQASMHRGFRASRPRTEASPGRRTVAELLDAAEARRTAREAAEAEREREQAEREKAARAAAYAKRLDDLAASEGELWQRVDKLIETKNVSSYDTAVALLVDLRALAERGGRPQEFGERVRALRALYSRRPGLLDRLAKAGLS